MSSRTDRPGASPPDPSSESSRAPRGFGEFFRTQSSLTIHLLRWILLGAASGVLAGCGSYVFLEALERATSFRVDHSWMLYLLPIAGLVIGLAYHHFGGRSAGGNSMIIEEIHAPTAWIPRRLAPLVFLGTVVSHLFGASVGREGTAIQMSGSLTDLLARTIRLQPSDRRILLIAAIAGGFGSVFGVPLAGAVFALEVQSIGRVRYDALVPAMSASIVGDLVVRGLGHHHALRPQLVSQLTWELALKVSVAGLVFGLAGAAFIELTHWVKRLASRVGWPPARPMIGGLATIGLALLAGRDYLGLSLPLIDTALAGHHTSLAVPALKLVFTAVALGTSFPGGEVTPLFVIGTTLGAALAPIVGVPIPVMAAIGFVAVFAGAANTPLACAVMGAELFGSGIIVPLAITCIVSYVFSSHRSIYESQRIDTGKGPWTINDQPRVGG